MGTTVTAVSTCIIAFHDLRLTGRGAIEGDDLGGASAGGISVRSVDDTAGLDLVATLMEGVVTMAAHVSNIGHGRAHEGGRGGQNRTPHDENGRVCRIDLMFSSK